MVNKKSTLEALRYLGEEQLDDDEMMGLSVVGTDEVALPEDNELNRKIVDKLIELSTALADEFSLNRVEVLKDMIRDLNLINDGDVNSLVVGDDPMDQATKIMHSFGKQDGLDSNIAINFLLGVDKDHWLEVFRHASRSGQGLLPNHAGGPRIAGGIRRPQPRMIGGPRGFNEELHKNIPTIDKLIESILWEKNFERFRQKTYPEKISARKVKQLVELDPTYEAGSEHFGQYGEWLVIRYVKEEVKEADLRRANEVLFDFNSNRRYLRPEQRDIYRYKSLDEILAALETVQLTQSQIQAANRRAKKRTDLYDEASFIAENDEWEIWSPDTYAASCKLGNETNWCTATTSSDNHFKHYTRDGSKLVVFLHKDGDISKKVQATVKPDGRIYELKTFKNTNLYSDLSDPSKSLMRFILENDLVSTLENSSLKHIDSILDAKNAEALQRGEPYMYAGGKIKPEFKTIVRVVKFVDDYPDNRPEERKTMVDTLAFAGCTNLERVYLHPAINYLGNKSFLNCDKVKIYTTNTEPIATSPKDIEFLRGRVKVVPHLNF